jgi:hypothetical protein
MYPDVKMPHKIRQNILNKFNSFKDYPIDLVTTALVKVEALFVFCIFKATLESQKRDPFIKNLLINAKIALDSPALTLTKQPYIEKQQLQPGILEFRMIAIRNELRETSLSYANQKYHAMTKFLSSVTQETMKDSYMFRAPIPTGYLLHRYKNIQECNRKVNEFPLCHTDWIAG